MQKVDLSRYDNSWYHHGKPLWFRVLWMICEAVFLRNPLVLSSKVKVLLLRAFGAKLGEGVVIKPAVAIKHPWLLEVGAHSWIGENSWIDNLAMVRLGQSCVLSQGCMLLTGNHDYRSAGFDLKVGEITLGDCAWVGARAVVCPGVVMGEGSVLSVSSTATRNLDAWSIYQGNPAQKVRERVIE